MENSFAFPKTLGKRVGGNTEGYSLAYAVCAPNDIHLLCSKSGKVKKIYKCPNIDAQITVIEEHPSLPLTVTFFPLLF